MAGIRTKGEGFANFVIAPQIVGDLQYVKAKHISPYGDVKVHWQRKGNALEINVEIPPNCKAELILPNFKKVLLSGKYFFKFDIWRFEDLKIWYLKIWFEDLIFEDLKIWYLKIWYLKIEVRYIGMRKCWIALAERSRSLHADEENDGRWA